MEGGGHLAFFILLRGGGENPFKRIEVLDISNNSEHFPTADNNKS
jgi:hypothetical protein